jgi:integrase
MARRTQAAHVFKKRGIYYFQRRVPKRVAKHYRSNRVIVSLRTTRKEEAQTRAREIAAQLEAFWWKLQQEQQEVPCEHLLVSACRSEKLELTLDDVATLYRERKGQGRDKNFHGAVDRAFSVFRSVAGNLQIEAYERKDALKLRDHLKAKGLAPQSIRRTVTTLRSAFNLAINEHGLTLKNIFASLDVGETELVRKRNPLDDAQLRAVQAECVRMDDEARWLVALISDTGIRLAEALGLLVEDLYLNEPVPYVDIRPHPWRSLKTAGSARKVPLVGYSLWAAQRIVAESKGRFAFPRYTDGTHCASNSASAALNKWLKTQVSAEGVVIHSFRHSLRDRLRSVECPPDIVDQIGGWKTDGVGQSYGHGYPLSIFAKWLSNL